MTKAIASYPVGQRQAVIDARLQKPTGGLGYLAAVDSKEAAYRAKMEEARKKLVKKEAETVS